LKDPITADLVATGVKAAPSVTVATATVAGGISPNSILIWLTILYTALLLFSLVVKNWGDWMNWWDARSADLRRLWGWIRRRG
jgi:hypothetical protein